MGPRGPDLADVDQGFPRVIQAGFRYLRGPHEPLAVPRGSVRNPALPVAGVPRDGSRVVLLGIGLLEGTRGPHQGVAEPAAVLSDAANARSECALVLADRHVHPRGNQPAQYPD